jgi:Cysteine-rich secretory protein family
MKLICFLLGMMIAVSSARAEDITAMISQYRREHGLPAVKTDAKLTAVAVRQAQAMASTGIMDHDVAGSFASRIGGANVTPAAENIAAGTKTWADTLRIWKESAGHNKNLLLADADSLGVAVARNENTRYKVYWAMVIGRKEVKRRGEMVAGGPDAGPRVKVRRTEDKAHATEESSVGSLLTGAVNRLRNLLP